MRRNLRSIKSKTRVGIALVISVLASLGYYLYYSGGLIEANSVQLQTETYPSLAKAKSLNSNIEKLSTTFTNALFSEDEDMLQEALNLGEICKVKLSAIRESKSSPLLDSLQRNLDNYISNASLVVSHAIKGKPIDFNIMGNVGSLFYDLEKFTQEEEARLNDGLRQIRYRARTNVKTSIYIFIITLCVLFLFFGFVLRILQTLGVLSHRTEQIAQGNFNIQIETDREDELGTLQKSFEQMRLNIGDLIQNLDRKVRKRTEDITNIMDNINIGLLTLNSDLIIQENYSRHTQEILGATHLGGTYFPGFIYPDNPQKADDLEIILTCLITKPTSKNLLLDALPDTYIPWNKMAGGKKQTRYLNLNFDKIVGHSGGSPHIMITLKDVTQEYDLHKQLAKNQEEYEENKALVSILIDNGREAFQSFVIKYQVILKKIYSRLALKAPLAPMEIGEFMRHIHTLKGDANIFSLHQISNAAHNVEYLLEESSLKQADLGREEREYLQGLLAFLQDSIRTMAEKVEQIFASQENAGFSGSRKDPPQAEKVAEVVRDIKRLNGSLPAAQMAPILEKLESLSRVPLSRLYGRLPRYAERLAARLGKEIYPIKAEGGDILVSQHVLNKIEDCFLHLVRNSIDHGIEFPHERTELGKKKKGRIQIKALRAGNKIKICIADDGRGIDWNKIYARAVERDIITWEDLNGLEENKKYQLMFKAGVSSKGPEDLTDISGRGIGMDVVKDSLEKLGGEIDFHSKVNEGTEFTLILTQGPI